MNNERLGKLAGISLLTEETVRTKDGKTYSGDRNQIEKALAASGTPAAEREAILAGKIPVTPQVAAQLVKSKAVKPDAATSGSPKKAQGAWDKYKAHKETSRTSPSKEFQTALKAFAANWSDYTLDQPDVEPEHAAPDAAENFFYDYHDKWKIWAQALGMSKSNMKEVVAERVYEAMTSGAKAGPRESVTRNKFSLKEALKPTPFQTGVALTQPSYPDFQICKACDGEGVDAYAQHGGPRECPECYGDGEVPKRTYTSTPPTTPRAKDPVLSASLNASSKFASAASKTKGLRRESASVNEGHCASCGGMGCKKCNHTGLDKKGYCKLCDGAGYYTDAETSKRKTCPKCKGTGF